MAASKQLYEAVAEGIRLEIDTLIELNRQDRTQSALRIQKAAGIESAARVIADAFKADNERFDTKRFLGACGVVA